MATYIHCTDTAGENMCTRLGTANQACLNMNPFITESSTDVTGIAGSGGNWSYCARQDTQASRYMLQMPGNQGVLVKIDITRNDTIYPAYCIEKGVTAPDGLPYQSAPFSELMPGYTDAQKNMIGWTLANGFPIISSAAMFDCAGVDWQAEPVLDDSDAYAVVSTAIWGILQQISTDQMRFVNCSGDGLHPKSDRLRAAALSLMTRASAYVQQPPGAAAQNSAVRHCGEDACISCCMEASDALEGQPYICFHGCPHDIRQLCGRLLVGPFQVASSFSGQIHITARPVCVCADGFSASFADFCGNPIDYPKAGEEFYLLLHARQRCFCFHLTATVTSQAVKIIFMEEENSGGARHQNIVFPHEGTEISAETSMCVLIESCGFSKDQEKCCACPHIHNITIQNTQNNTCGGNEKGGACTCGSSCPPSCCKRVNCICPPPDKKPGPPSRPCPPPRLTYRHWQKNCLLPPEKCVCPELSEKC